MTMQNSNNAVYVVLDKNGRIVKKNKTEACTSLQENSQTTSFVGEEEQGEGENINLNASAVTEVDKFLWGHETTLLFLDEYEKRYGLFRNPKIKKKKLWEEIRVAMLMKGYSVDCESLDRKMRNMKGTYKTIVDNNKKKKTGRGKVHWEYYTRFSQIFAEDKTIHPQYVVASMAKPRLMEDNGRVESPTSELSDLSSAPSPSTSCENNNSSSRPKRLDAYRKRCLEVEEDRLEELRKVRKAIEENNRINEEKLNLFKEFLNSKK